MTEARHPPLFNLTGKRVYVAGHTGMVGAALVRRPQIGAVHYSDDRSRGA